MIRPEVLDALLAAGATAEMIVAAVKADAAQEENKILERRAKDAERQRKSRASRNVTVTPCDRRDAPNDIYSNPDTDISPKDDKSSLPPKPKARRVSAHGEPLPAGWEPVLTPAAQRVVDGWPPGWLSTRLAEFRDHASDKGRRSKDWQAAFRKWLTNADEWGRQKNGRDGFQQGGEQGLGRTARAAIEVFGPPDDAVAH